MARLLFLTERFPPDIGGLARSAGRITQVITQLGIEVDVVAWSRQLQPGQIQGPEPEQIPRVYRIGLYRQWDMSLPVTLNLLDGLQAQYGYDGIWGHYLFPAGFMAAWFGQLRGIRCTVSARGNDVDRGLFPPGDFARLQWTLQAADRISAVSQDLIDKIQVLCQREDVILLQNAVDGGLFSPTDPTSDQGTSRPVSRESLGVDPDEWILGFSGELREKKGQAHLLEALRSVRAHHPACLLVIGEIRGSQEAVLQVFAAHYPEDAQRLIVTGHLRDPEQVVQHLRLCDLYLQPSLWEGMPNALLEAMATQLCCLVSDAGGIPEVITHSQTGFILPRRQLDHLGTAIIECMEWDVSVRQRIGQAARQHVLETFNADREKQRVQDLLDLWLGSTRIDPMGSAVLRSQDHANCSNVQDR